MVDLSSSLTVSHNQIVKSPNSTLKKPGGFLWLSHDCPITIANQPDILQKMTNS